MDYESHDGDPQYWQIVREELDRKANNELLVSIDVQRGDEAIQRQLERRGTNPLKSGFLLKNRPHGLRLQWQQRWFKLTRTSLVYAHDMEGKKQTVIPVVEIMEVRRGAEDVLHRFVLEVVVLGREPYRLAATTAKDRDDWIEKISMVSHQITEDADHAQLSTSGSSSDTTGMHHYEESIELVQSERGITQILPV